MTAHDTIFAVTLSLILAMGSTADAQRVPPSGIVDDKIEPAVKRHVAKTLTFPASDWRCCTARSKSLTSLCRLQSHPAQYVSGIPSAAILLSISHPIRCSTRCLANVRARISGPMIAL